MNKKKKKFILSLALALGVMTIGGIASATTLVRSEEVTISFYSPDSKSASVMGYANTGTMTTNSGTYYEEHWATDARFLNGSFYAQLVSVKPWYQPNEVKDTSYTVGTFGNEGKNSGYFNSGETLRTDMGAYGFKGYSMKEECEIEK